MQLTGRACGLSVVPSVAAVALVAACAAEGVAQAVPKASYVTARSFQLPPKGQPGAPKSPTALALGDDGAVHIADGRGMIFVYDSSGVYRRSYGRNKLDRPVALEVTPGGEIYVLDAGHNQVVVFGPGGQALRAIASKGRSGGQLADPVDMALGPSGYVYVLDRGRKGVQIFSRDGLYVRDVAVGDVASEPSALAAGNDGSIYVADKRTPGHVYVYPPFTEVPWIGPTPRGIAGRVAFRGARFADPTAVAVNHFGTVLVLDKRAGRLWRSNPDDQAELGPDDALYGGIGTGRGSFRQAADVAFAGPDQVMILDAQLRKVEWIALTTEDGLVAREDFGFPIRVTRGARSLPAPLYDIGYAPDGSPRLLLAAGKRAVNLMGTQTETHVTVYGDSVPAYLPNPRAFQRQFSQQIGEVATAVLNDTAVVVADPRHNRFAIFSLEGGPPLGTYGDNYQDKRKLRSPRGLAVLSDGRIVIGDTGNNRVKVFSPDLASLVASYPTARPVGIAVAPSGQILAWNEDGTLVGRLVTDPERFEPLPKGLLPRAVAGLTFDAAGNLFAIDRLSHRVTIVDASLTRVLMQLGSEGAMTRPADITVDRDGNIYVADHGAGRTVVFRWDIEFPPLADLRLSYEGDAALLEWAPGPAGFVSGYEIQGTAGEGEPYSVIATSDAPALQIDAATLGDPLPRFVRVAPVFITGVAGRPTKPLPLFNFTALSAYRRGDYTAALNDAAQAVGLIDDGVLDAGDDVRAELLWIAFASTYELRDFPAAITWARKLAPVVRRENIIDFLFRLAEVYLQLGDPRAASQQILALVGHDPRPEYFTAQPVIDQSFRIYRAVRDAGFGANALEFLRLYTQAIPSTATDLRAAYRDSIIVYDTRGKLGLGFQYWHNASYGQAVNFFESLLTSGGLSAEQQVIARQILAATYYAFGRRNEAEDTFREIYKVRPDFDLQSEIDRIRQLYGLTIYNPETLRFFGLLRSRS